MGGIHINKLSAYSTKQLPTPSLQYEMFRLFKQTYVQAYKWEIVHKNIFDKIDSPKRPPTGKKVVADAELAGLIIAAMHGERVEPIFPLEISCGMRLPEAAAIDWEDIDFRTGKIAISKSYHHVNHEGPQFFDPKTEPSHRTVSIPKNALARLLEIRCEGGVMRFGLLCLGNDGDRINLYEYRRYYKLTYKAKLPDQPYITPQNLRHTHATILLASKTDLKTIADRLGHANIGTPRPTTCKASPSWSKTPQPPSTRLSA